MRCSIHKWVSLKKTTAKYSCKQCLCDKIVGKYVLFLNKFR